MPRCACNNPLKHKHNTEVNGSAPKPNSPSLSQVPPSGLISPEQRFQKRWQEQRQHIYTWPASWTRLEPRGGVAGNHKSTPKQKKIEDPSATHRIKIFLKEISGANYWTRLQIVNDPKGAIQITVYAPLCPQNSFLFELVTCSYEDCVLLFRTAGMDSLQRTDAASATHNIYVPMLLLANIIGPHMKRGALH